MKFFVGVLVGAALMRFYGTEQGKKAFEQFDSATAQGWASDAGRAAAAGISTGAQRVAEMVDSSPLPAAVKSAASEAVITAWAAAESVAEQKTESDSAEKAKPAAETKTEKSTPAAEARA